jgi:hypothetical protein
MPTPPPTAQPAPPRELALLPGLLSYLIPGLGQVWQGRVAKGVLFFVCIYTLFFYGMYLGTGTAVVDGKTYHVSGSVYLPQVENAHNNPFNLPPFAANLYNRPQFAGQFWIGVAAWPALWQYYTWKAADDDKNNTLLGKFERQPREEDLNAVQTAGDKRMDLGWVYTVIAGVLNIMVIYDALAGPAFVLAPRAEPIPEEAAA